MQESSRKRKRVEESEEEEESKSCCLNQEGFRFQPSEQELISYFLYNRVTTNSLCFTPFIQDFDLYGSTEPWQIWDTFGGPGLEEKSQGKNGDLDLYFFTRLKKVSSKGSNFIRKVGSGSWQGEAKPKKIYANHGSNNCIGSMRRFRYENNKIPLQHGAWIMHEFSLQGSSTPLPSSDFVVCRFRKNDRRQKLNKSKNQGKVNHGGDHQTIQHTGGDDNFSSFSRVYNGDHADQIVEDTGDSSCLPASSSRVYDDESIEAGRDNMFSSSVPDLFTDEELSLTRLFTIEELLQGLPQPEMQHNWAGDDMLTASSIISYEELLASSYSMQKEFLPDGAEELEDGHDELLTLHTNWAQTFAQDLLGCQTCLV